MGLTLRPEKFPALRKIGVSTAAGSIVATSMPLTPRSSWRRHSLNARTANLLATYGLTCGVVTRPQTEDMLISTPEPCARKRFSAARAPCT